MTEFKKLALLIGVSEYGEGLDPLSAPAKDVAAMKRVLEDPNLCGFSQAHITVLLNPDSSEMQEKIEDLFTQSSKQDLVLLYFSGHGITDDYNRLYLTTRNTSKNRYRSHSVPASFIQNLSDDTYAQRQVIILDCCYSGAFAEGWQRKGDVPIELERELGRKGRVVLTSSSSTQVSFQQEDTDLSLYTQYFLEGIQSGAADDKQNGSVTVRELHSYAKCKVQEVKPKMQPAIIVGDDEGYDIILSKVKIDAESLFRKCVEQYVDHSRGKICSDRAQEILDKKAKELGLVVEQSERIIANVLEPTCRRLENIERYRLNYKAEAEKEYPIREALLKELHTWQQEILGLKDEDIRKVRDEIDAVEQERLRLLETWDDVIDPEFMTYEESRDDVIDSEFMTYEESRKQNRTNHNKVVGIDFGTTNSRIAVMEGNTPIVIADTEGFRSTPSVVAYERDGDFSVGQTAEQATVMNPENTFYSVKRFIGCQFDEVNASSTEVAYTVLDVDNEVKLNCTQVGKQLTPIEVVAQVLRKLADNASKYLDLAVTQAVVTVPVYFNKSQRRAIRVASEIAGLSVLRVINDSTALALSHTIDMNGDEGFLVIDIGGGTFEVAVLEGGPGISEVQATLGDNHLGGDNFDKAIVDYLAEEFQRNEGIDLRKDTQALSRMTKAAEKAKIELSDINQSTIDLPFITSTEHGHRHLKTILTRAKFEALIADLIERCRTLIKRAMKDAKVEKDDINRVLLTGGSVRIPAVQEAVKDILGEEVIQSVLPSEVVAIGAAILGSVLEGNHKDVLVLDATPLSLGIETLGGVMTEIINCNTTIPTKKSEIFSTASDGQPSVAIHILQGERVMASDNKSLYAFRLDGIPPAQRGVPQIEVTFEIGCDCDDLTITVKDKGSGITKSVSIAELSPLCEEEVRLITSCGHLLPLPEELMDVDD